MKTVRKKEVKFTQFGLTMMTSFSLDALFMARSRVEFQLKMQKLPKVGLNGHILQSETIQVQTFFNGSNDLQNIYLCNLKIKFFELQ